MWNVFEPWQLGQLQRLAQLDPERAETIMNTLWNSYPGLLEELAVSAVDQEHLSVGNCAAMLQISAEEVEIRLLAFRRNSSRLERAVVQDEIGKVARLAPGGLAVWEVVREYRKLGSVQRLTEAFPALPTSDLAAALKYAEQNPAEIEQQISRYEGVLQKRRAEYPFAR